MAIVGDTMARHGVDSAMRYIEHSAAFPGQVRSWIHKGKRAAAKQQPCRPGDDNDVLPPAQDAAVHRCECCSAAFPTLHKVRAHMWGQHKHNTLLADLAPSTRCPCCLTEFWLHKRLLRHLAHDSPSCGHHVLAEGSCSATNVQALRAREDTLPKDTLPAVRVTGPLPPCKSDWVSAEQLCRMQSFFEDDGRGAVDPIYAAQRSLSEYACANAATRDAFLESLGPELIPFFQAVHAIDELP